MGLQQGHSLESPYLRESNQLKSNNIFNQILRKNHEISFIKIFPKM